MLMAKITEAIWEIEEHTKAKHEILKRYLAAWFAILGRNRPHVIYIDGFCGPGQYLGGEIGSPVIALEEALKQKIYLSKTKVDFLFIDENCDRIEYLKTVIAGIPLPNNFRVHIETDQFENVLSSILDHPDSDKISLAPTFAFVDPFGWKGIPFSIIKRLLENDSTEVFVTFMVDSINRFIDIPDPKGRQHIYNLLGLTQKEINPILAASDRIVSLIYAYKDQLTKHANFVRYFEMRNDDNRIIYYLVFAGNHPLGHLKMKEAFWKVDNQSGFSFSDKTNPDQPVLFTLEPTKELADSIFEYFNGKKVPSEEVIIYVENQTPYITSHATKALSILESTGRIRVDSFNKYSGKRRASGFPPGVAIYFY
jgi:three-Cys-motif partner protein